MDVVAVVVVKGIFILFLSCMCLFPYNINSLAPICLASQTQSSWMRSILYGGWESSMQEEMKKTSFPPHIFERRNVYRIDGTCTKKYWLIQNTSLVFLSQNFSLVCNSIPLFCVFAFDTLFALPWLRCDIVSWYARI